MRPPTVTAMADSVHYNGRVKELLKRYFGFDEFRPYQAEIINSVSQGRDTLVLMPTGGGKSLCFQLPSLSFPGVTLVVSPLIALMKDQVDALKRNGVPVEYLNSTQSRSEQVRIQRAAFGGDLKLLYVAPERITRPGFQQFLEAIDLSLIAVDEAHCISEWGHEFRPDYRNLRTLRQLKPGTPVIALTATATESVRDDIVDQLGLSTPAIFVTSFDRPNLMYRVLPNIDRYDHLLDRLRDDPSASAIIYRSSRAGTEDMVADLAEDGIRALPYHAGLDDGTRARNQEQFVRDEVQAIVATVAFGMGIDKPDVRLLIHYEMPPSIERYYQESGRAGRDGLEAECIVYFGPRERERQEYFLDRIDDQSRRHIAQQKIRDMVAYCQTASCRRGYILQYFEELPGASNCGNCDVCTADTFDATVIAQKVLSTVIRTGQRFGASYISQVLRGADTVQVRDRGHKGLSVYGIVDDFADGALKQIASMLVSRGLLTTGNQLPTLSVTTAGQKFLKSRESITLPVPKGARSRDPDRTTALSYDKELFEKLRRVRTRLATELNVPPYMVFGDRTLQEMAHFIPLSSESLLRINGVGHRKLEDFGPAFLGEVATYAEPRGLDDLLGGMPVPGKRAQAQRTNGARSGRRKTLAQTLELASHGLSIEQIAGARGLAQSTVAGHIEDLIESGSLPNYGCYLPEPEKLGQIRTAFDLLGLDALRPVRDHLGDEYTYEDLRIARAHFRRCLRMSAEQPKLPQGRAS